MNSVLDNFIINKKKELAKLKKEYQMILESNTEISNSGSEVFFPKCDLFLSAWARHTLEEDIKEKENILGSICKMEEESTEQVKLILEDLRSRNESLKCLHRKLVRRLRRLSRCFSTTQSEKICKSIRNESGEILTNSFYRVLKNLIVELQDRTFTSNDWDQLQSVLIDQTYNKEHIKLLQESDRRAINSILASVCDEKKAIWWNSFLAAEVSGAREVYRRMKTVYREHSLSTTRVQEWRKRFSEEWNL
ncbi:uncharacterized protein CEXT_437161 [Caerostris extrusa]|uniref:Uncharacterized protein n=1 Tax=Caerostris extrusa TaxID=172846 RepID=A0AAV4RQ24_CAEEX|nr:uncharacterized protein CEXT_437161 [Caerostris extrusa]